MKFGIYLGNGGPFATQESIAALARAADDLGYDAVSVADHVVMPDRLGQPHPYASSVEFVEETFENVYEPLATLAYVAGLTSRARLLAGVLVLPYRHPLLAAKMLATVDRLSSGRLIVGAGVGWLRDEFEALGADFERRGQLTDEALRVFKAVWTEERPEFHGRFFDFGPLRFHPRPVQRPHPPIWIGGHSPRALRRAAVLGDGWHATRRSPEALRALLAQLRACCEDVGRDPATVTVSMKCNLRLDETAHSDADLDGTPARVAEQARAYRALGVELLVLDVRPQGPPAQQVAVLERFAREVRPAVEAA